MQPRPATQPSTTSPMRPLVITAGTVLLSVLGYLAVAASWVPVDGTTFAFVVLASLLLGIGAGAWADDLSRR